MLTPTPTAALCFARCARNCKQTCFRWVQGAKAPARKDGLSSSAK
nr:MAG TPA: hypothetical protein [Caudoviricetes sp.]DAR09377.1 MAG TPA: hypothetical protein [Caudoviricetes sp.]DAR95987.1 MAG TPA: hypothetical protein [Caudoviricetes sp.]